MAPTWDIQLTTKVLPTVVSSPVIKASAVATVCLVKVVSGAMSIAAIFSGSVAWWRHFASFSCVVTRAVAVTAISLVQISGGTMPTAIFECLAWWRDAAVLASVAAFALACAAIR
jgi:hypothetical protein